MRIVFQKRNPEEIQKIVDRVVRQNPGVKLNFILEVNDTEVPKERFKATNPGFNLTPEQLITLKSRIQLNKDYATSEILQILSDVVGYKVSRLRRIVRYAEWTVSYVRAQSRVVFKSWK